VRLHNHIVLFLLRDEKLEGTRNGAVRRGGDTYMQELVHHSVIFVDVNNLRDNRQGPVFLNDEYEGGITLLPAQCHIQQMLVTTSYR
tara:strand:+ start:250 stop:510 length:261 start_codon:yes stop_codon:yes gene_type:complete